MELKMNQDLGESKQTQAQVVEAVKTTETAPDSCSESAEKTEAAATEPPEMAEYYFYFCMDLCTYKISLVSFDCFLVHLFSKEVVLLQSSISWDFLKVAAVKNRLLRKQSSSGGYNTKRLRNLQTETRSEIERIQIQPAAKGAKIPRTRHPVTKEVPDAMIGQKLPVEAYKLPQPTQCCKCGALKFSFETLHFCYCDGEVKIATNEHPPELVRLFTSMDEDAKHFRIYIWLYNNMFTFTSLGGKMDAKKKKGIYVFKLHGQIYHNLSGLISGDVGPKYMQLYFYDGQVEAEKCLRYFPKLREDVLAILMKVTELNPYARFFRSLKDISINESTEIVLNKTTVPDQRVYNAPSTDEVVVIWPENTSSRA
ncbi:uncharacterized protein LOC110716798 [Chenopodium quinoa]|uniref:uncharacterized protein LOC110716798 n=1 Tax=Chenopodium quinoa TaxID=63459 RepID=UPI000B78EED3|nr:uncharacterized protein LOC110716798 [Chenopodium quinoa]